jgi:hypothetical protein
MVFSGLARQLDALLLREGKGCCQPPEVLSCGASPVRIVGNQRKQLRCGLNSEGERQMLGWVADIEKLTFENGDFRRVVYTGEHTQLTLMRLGPVRTLGGRHMVIWTSSSESSKDTLVSTSGEVKTPLMRGMRFQRTGR